ncbi:unnamed protein product [Strongylus vulgaris]|uniref:C-type lectin domain-containing protein n=1 Tax=Strongylus vulgaris TaxID=40348 RepID=A0A3P7LT29_STRVU|nr:unnamed protein product [Strongylus vulgaris]
MRRIHKASVRADRHQGADNLSILMRNPASEKSLVTTQNRNIVRIINDDEDKYGKWDSSDCSLEASAFICKKPAEKGECETEAGRGGSTKASTKTEEHRTTRSEQEFGRTTFAHEVKTTPETEEHRITTPEQEFGRTTFAHEVKTTPPKNSDFRSTLQPGSDGIRSTTPSEEICVEPEDDCCNKCCPEDIVRDLGCYPDYMV